MGRSSPVVAGTMLRARPARVVRADTDIAEVIQLVGGIAKIQTAEPGQLERLLDMALDGLRYQGPAS